MTAPSRRTRHLRCLSSTQVHIGLPRWKNSWPSFHRSQSWTVSSINTLTRIARRSVCLRPAYLGPFYALTVIPDIIHRPTFLKQVSTPPFHGMERSQLTDSTVQRVLQRPEQRFARVDIPSLVDRCPRYLLF